MSTITSGRPATNNGSFSKLTPLPAPPLPRPSVGFHGAVCEFKRRLIEATLAQSGGNRTRAAKALGLQRTYLLGLCPSEGFALVSFTGVALSA